MLLYFTGSIKANDNSITNWLYAWFEENGTCENNLDKMSDGTIYFNNINERLDDYLFRDVIKKCKEENVDLTIDADFYGDDEGSYHYKTGEDYGDDIALILDQRGTIIANMDADELVEICKKRGIWPNDEAIYRKVEHRYLLQDAKNHLEPYIESGDIEESDITDDDYEALVSMYEDERDCNVPENTTWDNVIAEYIRKAGK